MVKCKSFSPRINEKSRVLILGSMPGVKSLEMQEYYAHPQNRFWKVMGKICNCEGLHDMGYEDKIQVLLDNRFALWDVIASCEREGSLDSNIGNEKPNEIPKLLERYKNIKTICLNGNKAYSAFAKHFPDLLKIYICYKMPSTSPANARFKLENLYDKWKEVVI